MNPEIILKHEFVEFIPGELKQGTIYISTRFGTASHLCVCGCGNKVVTPLRPTDWRLIFDGKTISLDPSIGNWSFPCQSHYWIRNNKIRWATQWSNDRIEIGRTYDRMAKDNYFNARDTLDDLQTPTQSPETVKHSQTENGMWRQLMNILWPR
jgi:hypothetical protein